MHVVCRNRHRLLNTSTREHDSGKSVDEMEGKDEQNEIRYDTDDDNYDDHVILQNSVVSGATSHWLKLGLYFCNKNVAQRIVIGIIIMILW